MIAKLKLLHMSDITAADASHPTVSRRRFMATLDHALPKSSIPIDVGFAPKSRRNWLLAFRQLLTLSGHWLKSNSAPCLLVRLLRIVVRLVNAWDYYIESEYNCVFVTHYGDFSISDAGEQYKALLADPIFRSGLNMIRDCRLIEMPDDYITKRFQAKRRKVFKVLIND